MSDSFPWSQKAAETAWSSTGAAQPTPVKDGNQPELVLRVCGSSNDGTLIRLRSAKCSIGSGPQCTLRLHSPRFQPVHCLILRGPNATVVRSWAAGTRLNGRPFGDAPLAPGDRLGIGPIELEVVELGRPVAKRAAYYKSQEHTGPLVAELVTSAGIHQEALTEDQSSFSSTSSTSCSHDEAREDASSLQRQQPFSGGAEMVPDPAHAFLRRREDALRTARQRNRRLIKRLRQLKAELAEMARVRPVDSAGLDTPEQYYGPSPGAEREDSGRRSGELGELRECAAGENTIEPGEADQTVYSWDAEPAAPERSESPGNQPTAQPKAGAPVDLAEVFRRIGVAGQLLDVAEKETAGSSGAADTAPVSDVRRPAEASPSTQPQHAHPEGDDAIEAYMQQLLHRLRGSPSASKVGGPRESYRRGGSAADSVSAQAGDGLEPPAGCPREVGLATAELQTQEALAEARVRALPPEKLTGLSAMREVANISAQAALSQHARRTLTRTRRFKLLASLASAGSGVGLLWLWASYSLPLATLAIGLMSLTAGVVWAIQYAVLTGRLVLHRPRQSKPPYQSGCPQARAQPQPPQCSPTGGTQTP